MTDFDAIVIGSGFGGAITACRLAQAGLKVLILERGRRWDKTTYPSRTGRGWIWSHSRPESSNGWIDMRVFRHMAVVQGAGVGGGSLIYANISCEAPRSVFDEGWPAEITYQELKPHYDKVADFMDVQKVPANQWNPRMRLMQEAAGKIGEAARFRQLELAVSFDPGLMLDPEHPPAVEASRRFTNKHGVEQGYCVHLGDCDIGCRADAKNTLDKNYIPVAEKAGAQVRPLHLATDIEPVPGGYRVRFDRLEQGERQASSHTARIVVVAGGSINSTELLLRCRDVSGTLPNLSRALGRGWSSNGDFLTPAMHTGRKVLPTVGPTIATAIDFLDRSFHGQSFWIEDGGMPSLAASLLSGAKDILVKDARMQALILGIQRRLRTRGPVSSVMPWFAQAVDAADGVLSLKRRWGFFGAPRLRMDWDIKRSKGAIDAVIEMHKRLSEATGGSPMVPPTWTIGRDLVTPHPLGGCRMAGSANEGVVNHAGEVFGYKNLYVADAAVIPRALGVNPSRTIGALAERIASMIVRP